MLNPVSPSGSLLGDNSGVGSLTNGLGRGEVNST